MGILDNVQGFMSPQAIENLHTTILKGYKTAQQFMEPAPVVEVFREPVGGGPPTSQGTFTAIMIRFGVREVRMDGSGPITYSSNAGTMHHEFDEFDLQVGDVIKYEGRSASVTAVNPQEFGVVISDLQLDQ